MTSTTGPDPGTLLFTGAGPNPCFRNKSVHTGRWAWRSSKIHRAPSRRLSSIFWCLGGGEGGEVLDREPETVTFPDLRGHLLGSIVHLDSYSKGRKFKAAPSVQDEVPVTI